MVETVQPFDVTTPGSLIDLRRTLHGYPELRFDLPRTAALVEARLRAAGWEIQAGIATSGILASMSGLAAGPHVALRADMDGIAVHDVKDVPYASRNAGVTHACGHDVHTCVAVGVAERLAASPITRGRVSILFQPAEEMPYGAPSGAQAMLDAGLFEADRPDAILALHCWPDLPAGTIGVDDHIAMGAKDAFHIRLRGRPAHAATPGRGRDAILGISQLVMALYGGFARSLDPGDLSILNLGTVRGGTSQSIVAAEAEVTGTIRSVDKVVRARLRDMAERTVAGVAVAGGLDPELTWSEAVPAVENDERLVALVRQVGSDVLGPEQTRRLTVPPMTADDFAFLAELAPALYLKLGVCGGPACPPLHSGAFDVDERAIGVGVAVMHELIVRLLHEPLES